MCRTTASAPGRDVLVRVLGPLEVFESESRTPLPGPIPTRILALLTTNLEAGLRTDALIDGVWGDAATDAALATLQSHVARLRRALGAGRVVTTADGYRLALPPAAIDAHQFETSARRGAALLADARPAEAASVLGEALRLWRGEPYQGLDSAGLLHERARLTQLRFDTLLQRIEADLAVHPAHTLVAEIETLLESSPTNEHLWEMLMRAWHAMGDTAAALEVFSRARSRLRSELGLEPGAGLRARQNAILQAAPGQTPGEFARRGERRVVSVVAVSELGADTDPEIAQASRARLLATLHDEVERLHGTVVRSSGPVALAVFGAVTAREDDGRRARLCGQRIAAATGSKVGMASGLALVTPELSSLGAVADRAVSHAVLAEPGEVVADPDVSHGSEPAREVPFIGRRGEVERLTTAIRDAARNRRSVVVPVIAEAGIGKSRLVSEVRRANPGVVWMQAQCDPLGERGGLDSLVEAWRENAPEIPVPYAGSRSEAIAAWSSALARLAADGPAVLCVEDGHWASELLLDLLDGVAAAPLLASMVVFVTARPEIEVRRPSWLAGARPMRLASLDDAETDLLARAVLAQTGASEADRQALAAACGGVPLFAVELGRVLSADAGHRIPDQLSDLMAARIDSLAPAARTVLTDASIVGSTFWAESLGVDPAALEPLLEREFIREVHPSSLPGTNEYRFGHDLVREAAYGRLLRPDRASGHLAVALWWGNLERGQDDAIVAEHAWLAHVLFGETDLVDDAAELAFTASRAAGVAARGVDTAAAVTFLQRASTLCVGRPVEPVVLVELAEALAENRLLSEADEVLRSARGLVDRADGHTRLRAAFLRLQLDFGLGHPQDPQALDQLLTDFPDGPVHIQALGVLAVNLVIAQTSDSFHRALEVSDKAIGMARDLGDEDVAVLSFATRGRARLALGDERGLADMDRTQERGVTLLPPFVVLGTRQWYAGAAHHWSGPAVELKIREELEHYAWRTGMEFLVSFGIAERLRCLWELGRNEECVAEADRIERRDDAMTRWVVVQRALALADLGRLDDEVLAEVLATPPADPTDLRHVIGTVVVRARHALDRGDTVTASAALEELGDLTTYAARDGAAEFLPRVLRLAAEAGLTGLGAELADVTFEPTPLGRAMTASVRGLVRRDPALLREALAAWEALGSSVDARLAMDDLGDRGVEG